MAEYGDLRSVVLYRDLGRNRWRYAVYDTLGVSDGYFNEVPADADLADAVQLLDRHLAEHWRQEVQWPWVEDPERPGWWTAEPPPAEV